MTLPAIHRIGSIELPPLSRLAWTSSEARAVWEPRLDALRDGNLETALAAVERGEAPVALLAVAPDRLFDVRARVGDAGLELKRPGEVALGGLVPTPVRSRYATSRALPQIAVAGPAGAADEVARSLAAGDPDAVASLLGVADCCRSFARDALTGWTSAWWPVAAATARRRGEEPGLSVACEAGPPAILLLHDLGIASAPHLPCGFDCGRAAAGAARVCERRPAPDRELVAAFERWPVAWSGLHGLGELKTPVLKLIRRADTTVERLSVQMRGSATAVEAAARGVRQPFVLPMHLKRISGSVSIGKGSMQ